MAKQIITLAGLTAEDMGYIRAVLAAELTASRPHWSEPAPEGFAKRLDDCQVVAMSSLEQAITEKEQHIADLQDELSRR